MEIDQKWANPLFIWLFKGQIKCCWIKMFISTCNYGIQFKWQKLTVALIWLRRVVIKMANFFLNILDWFKARLSKWRTFLELSKWRIIFYQNDELFRSYQNGELLRYQNRELFLSKWRISFIKMANFVQRFFSKWRIFRFCHWMAHKITHKKVDFCLPR